MSALKNIFIFAFLLTSIFFCNSAFSKPSQTAQDDIKDCPDKKTKTHYSERVVCIKERLLTTGRMEEQAALFYLFIGDWEHGGFPTKEILSNLFLDLVADNPEVFFVHIVNYQELFDEWRNNLLELSFTWHGDPPSLLRQKKKRILSLLQKYRPQNKEMTNLKAALVTTLRSIAPDDITDCPDKENYYDQRVACIEAKLLITDQMEEQEQLFKLLITYWVKRDGAEGFSLSDMFLDFLEKKPDVFFAHMVNYRESFEEWLNELLYLSFTWHGDPPSPLPQKKERTLSLLHAYRSKNKEMNELKEKLLDKLISIQPEQVQ